MQSSCRVGAELPEGGGCALVTRAVPLPVAAIKAAKVECVTSPDLSCRQAAGSSMMGVGTPQPLVFMYGLHAGPTCLTNVVSPS